MTTTNGYTISGDVPTTTNKALRRVSSRAGVVKRFLAGVAIVLSLVGVGVSVSVVEEHVPQNAAFASDCQWWDGLCHGGNIIGGVIDWTATKASEGFEWVGGVITQAVVAGVNTLLVMWLCHQNGHLSPSTVESRPGDAESLFGVLGGYTSTSKDSFRTLNFPQSGSVGPSSYVAKGGQGSALPWSKAYAGDAITGEGKYLTAYEKYGVFKPVYDSWFPSYPSRGSAAVYVPQGSLLTLDDKNVDFKYENFVMVDHADGFFMTVVPFDCINLNSWGADLLNALTALPRFALWIGVEIYGMAVSQSVSNAASFTLLGWFGELVEDLITKPGGLKDAIFFPFLLPLILMGTVYVAWVGLIRRHTSKAIYSVGWLVSGTVVAVFTMTNPLLFPMLSDYVVSNVSSAFSQAVNASTPDSELCTLPDDYETATGMGTNERYVLETKCLAWKVGIYDPWVSGQFGVLDTADRLNLHATLPHPDGGSRTLTPEGADIYLGEKNKLSRVDWGLYHLDRQSILNKAGMTDIAYAQLSGHGYKVGADGTHEPVLNIGWGWASESMISSSLIMIITALPLAGVLIAFGFMMLVYQLSLLGLILLGPVLMLPALIPSWGQRILGRLGAELLNLTFKRIITGVVLSIYLFFLTHVSSNAFTQNINYLMVPLLVILLTALVFFLRGQLMGLMSPSAPVFGGTDGRVSQTSASSSSTNSKAGGGVSKLTNSPVSKALANKVQGKKLTSELTPPNPFKDAPVVAVEKVGGAVRDVSAPRATAPAAAPAPATAPAEPSAPRMTPAPRDTVLPPRPPAPLFPKPPTNN